jgi:hypothetical protein
MLGGGLLALCPLLLIALAVFVGRIEADTRWLEVHGASTVGVVQKLHEEPTRRGVQRSADVAYQVGSDWFATRIWLHDGSEEHAVGSQVRVLYDPAAPERAAIDGERGGSPLEVLAVAVLLVGALFALGGAVGTARRVVLWRRTLARASWRAFACEAVPVPGANSTRLLVALRPLGEPGGDGGIVRLAGSGRRLARVADGGAAVWVAEHRGRMVAATPGPAALFVARRARDEQERAKWAALAASARG